MATVTSSKPKSSSASIQQSAGSTFRHNRVDIYIRERNGSREIRIPWLPEKVIYTSGGAIFATYSILNKGDVAVPTGSGLAGASWDSTFPGYGRNDNSMQRGTWKDPSTYHNILEDWKANGTPLNLLVVGYPINLDVLVEDYDGDFTGAFGDIDYSVKFKEDRDLTITSTTVAKSSQSTETKRSTVETTSYTIVKGDCLWSISQRFLGAGSKWRTIYEANKEIIESTAKKYGRKSSDNGWWIYPGVTIQIPKA